MKKMKEKVEEKIKKKRLEGVINHARQCSSPLHTHEEEFKSVSREERQ